MCNINNLCLKQIPGRKLLSDRVLNYILVLSSVAQAALAPDCERNS